MCYDAETRQRLDRVITTFKRYIEANSRFDIVFSMKAGFIRVSVGDQKLTAERISDADDMIGVILKEMVYDAVLSHRYNGMVPDCDDPFERAKRILYSYADADEATLEKFCTALAFMLESFNKIRNA